MDPQRLPREYRRDTQGSDERGVDRGDAFKYVPQHRVLRYRDTKRGIAQMKKKGRSDVRHGQEHHSIGGDHVTSSMHFCNSARRFVSFRID